MQKFAQTTLNHLPSLRNPTKDLERRRHTQSGWKNHPFHLWFLLTNLGRDEVILGYPWLTAFEPTIHWKDATLDKIHQPVIISSIDPREVQISSAITEDEWEKINKDLEEVPYLAIRNYRVGALEPTEGGETVSLELESTKVTL